MTFAELPADARDLIAALRLEPHPEGGFYRETFRSPLLVEKRPGVMRSASTAIYFLLPAGAFSAWHKVTSDEAWHHYLGDPVDLHWLDEKTGHQRVRLGGDVRSAEVPQHVVRAGVYQAAAAVGTGYALCGCTVAPGFDFADFSMPSRSELAAAFPAHRAIIEAFTRH
jgi:predicted cupin superfamily sugar epimerase